MHRCVCVCVLCVQVYVGVCVLHNVLILPKSPISQLKMRTREHS